MASPDSAAKSAAASATSAAASAQAAATALEETVNVFGLPSEAAAQAYNIQNDAGVQAALAAHIEQGTADAVTGGFNDPASEIGIAATERFGRIFTPEFYGADPTGAADAQAALAAAYAAAAATIGGGVVLLTGTYKVSSTWVLNAAKTVQVIGYGATIKPDPGVRAIRFNAGSAQTAHNTVLMGVTIDGGGATSGSSFTGATAGSGIEIRNHYAAVLRDVKVRKCHHGILITGDSGGWSESSVLDNVLVDYCMTGIEFAIGTGTGSFGYLNWGYVAVYNVPDAGVGVKIGDNSTIYHARIGTLAVQVNGDTATAMHIAGKIGRNSDYHIILESSANSYPTSTIVNRIGLDIAATAVLDGAAILSYWQGTWTSKINNPGSVVFQIMEGGANAVRARATGLANSLRGFGVFGDTFDRLGLRADRIVFGSGSAAPDSSIVRWGPDRIGPDGGDTWYVDGTWNGGKIRQGANREWYDATGVKRGKGSDPASDTDGDPLGGGPVAANSTQLASLTATINTVGKFWGKCVFNTSTGKPVWATGSSAAAVWNDATGAVAHTPV